MKRYIIPAAVVIILAFFTGSLVGMAAAGGPPERVEVPGPTVTKTAEPVTLIEEVEVEVTPPECLTALEDADDLMFLAGAGFEHASYLFDLNDQFLNAAAEMDLFEMDRIIVELENADDMADVLAEIENSTYPTNRDACREAQ